MDKEIIRDGKLKDRIITLLSITHPLSAKQIFNKLKKNYEISVTYRAVYKAIQEMMLAAILTKKEKEYQINFDWLQKMEQFTEKVKEKYQESDSMKNIKVISFDLDGCLSDNAFDEIVWRTEIPKIYAKEKNLSFEQAFQEVTAEYKRLWGKVDWWRDVQFWFTHFNLHTSWETVLQDVKKHIKHYGDVIPVLTELQKHFLLIIISHADRRFLNLKIEANNLKKFFSATYSTISDFHEYKKNQIIFQTICKNMNIIPDEMIHIGDSQEYDYKIPTSCGIKSYLIDRASIEKKENVARDLYEFKERILSDS